MTTQNKVLLFFVLLFLSNCAADNSFVTNHKDAWLSDSDRGLVYCKANVKSSNLADPVCFEAGFQGSEQEQSSSK